MYGVYDGYDEWNRATLDGLDPNTEYAVSIAARNAASESLDWPWPYLRTETTGIC